MRVGRMWTTYVTGMSGWHNRLFKFKIQVGPLGALACYTSPLSGRRNQQEQQILTSRGQLMLLSTTASRYTEIFKFQIACVDSEQRQIKKNGQSNASMAIAYLVLYPQEC